MRRTTVLALAALVALSVSCGGNHAPRLLPLQNRTVETGSVLEFMVEAVDDDGDRLEFAAQGLPSRASFDQVDNNSARFQWAPLASDAGPQGEGKQYPVTFLVSDGHASDSEEIIITVVLGGEGSGAPVFITPSDYTLDLDKTDTINIRIEVRDNDSAQVDLRIVDNPPGGTFSTQPGSKIATYVWTPTAQQVAERPVWSFRVGASDRQNPEVFQDITILLKGGQKKCEGTPPVIQHQPLGDQRAAGDYLVEVTVSDGESQVQAAALYWMVRGSGDESFSKQSMNAVGGGRWQGSIPNPQLPEGKTAEVLYYVCAVDDDDPTGTECDLRSCIPEDGRFSFTAYAAGSSDCENDTFEGSTGNDEPAAATDVTLDSNGEAVMEGLKICPGDVDWFRLQIPAAQYWAGALLGHVPANGQLVMDLFADDGTTLLAEGQQDGDDVLVYSDVFSSPATVLLRVQGASPDVENRYDLYTVVAEYRPCDPDSFEQNDTPSQATEITEDVYNGLSCCGDSDWYKIWLEQGDKLEVEIYFKQADGDLDLWLVDEQTANSAQSISCDNALACSVSETDDESVVLGSAPSAGWYYVAVSPYQGARNAYDMLVVVTPASTGCTDDGQEPNDDPDGATELEPGSSLTGMQICPDNEDWFWMILSQGEHVVIDLTFTHADGDLDMRFYDGSVTPNDLDSHQLATSLSTDDNEHIEYDATKTDFYYVRVYGWSGASNTYSISVTSTGGRR